MKTEKDNSYIELKLKNIVTGIGVIILLAMGGGLSITAFEHTFRIGEFFNFKALWFILCLVGALLVSIPSIMISRGNLFFVKINFYICLFQIFLFIITFIANGFENLILSLSMLFLPTSCIFLLKSKHYKEFSEFYYFLQLNRKNKIKNLLKKQ